MPSFSALSTQSAVLGYLWPGTTPASTNGTSSSFLILSRQPSSRLSPSRAQTVPLHFNHLPPLLIPHSSPLFSVCLASSHVKACQLAIPQLGREVHCGNLPSPPFDSSGRLSLSVTVTFPLGELRCILRHDMMDAVSAHYCGPVRSGPVRRLRQQAR